MRAVGCHVFAGGFTMGVQRVMPVDAQVEIHDFGRETVEARIGIPFINRPTWRDWPAPDSGCAFCFGNPRCTGFSSLSAGSDDTVHGPFAHCTQDIRDLCSWAHRHDVPVFSWESVQQATTVGRPLLNHLVEQVRDKYRVAHVLVNVASFGGYQRRKRYFFVAYRRGLKFNVEPPPLADRQATVRDAIEHLEAQAVRQVEYDDCEYDENCYQMPKYNGAISLIPHLEEGMTLNGAGRAGIIDERFPEAHEKWQKRGSDMPFSLHCARRLKYDAHCSTMYSSAWQYVHPRLHRTLTIGELSQLMGWHCIPVGPKPVAQLAKGVCPEAGEWIAEQARLCLEGAWGSEDWESEWDEDGKRWVGRRCSDADDEKTFNLTRFAPCSTTETEAMTR